ncbi:YggS family pyridoxal phosphate-dependent enzyme [Notoacmeibacter sp. MSK16QG-6]|uniref:YggS family pyridoxal phosphate-dependent enzyme n=1 Tax=Notoacmeibacter sp. MSK16QG-6 TaxID=2957982 RepID=UPI00209E14EC|nr:YggS family pyridoxal phosphate-dependent enzyme [Notoacmeibacter sp. MSK16QG-6]MCP1199294.1 YggS family pyridoxal phosphate-dependent enzyme [Notoacmeibacter sp. MSK16QG-6]
MSETAERLDDVKRAMNASAEEAGRPASDITLVAVSKTHDAETIRPVLDAGQRIFGENRVQEAQGKWPALREDYPDTELHLIGPLQSNKAADAVALFDVIETVDREKIARELAKEIEKQGKTPRLLVQVNTGKEEQKAGIMPEDAVAFVARCRDEYGLTIDGLMCIPPVDDNPGPHFALLDKLANEAGLSTLSMGMSADFETAIRFGATHIRVGSAIFGERDYG